MTRGKVIQYISTDIYFLCPKYLKSSSAEMDITLSQILWAYPDSKVHGANMGPTWVLSAPDGPHDGPMNLDIRVYMQQGNNIAIDQITLSMICN